jgi:outer membrane protein TolC
MKWKDYFSDSALINLIDTALKNNLDLLIALQRIEMARAGVRFSKGLMLPSIDVFGSAGLMKFGKYTMDGAGNSGTYITEGQLIPEPLPDYSLGLQTSWEIDVRGKLRNRKKAAVAQYLVSIEGKNWAITNLITEISTAYFDAGNSAETSGGSQ